jgi:hypothetical protein
LGFEPNNERLGRLRIRGKFHNITIIGAYAPTEDKDEALKEQFYEDLQKLQGKVPRHDLLIIAGDFNAKVGRESAYKGVVEKYSIHPISNLNGEYLCNHAISNNVTIASTQFQHKRVHLGTWTSPDGQTVNQIVHVLVNKTKRGMIQDVRTMRRPKCDSDHFMLKVKVKQRLITSQMKKVKKPDGIRKICVINRKCINIGSYYIKNYKTNSATKYKQRMDKYKRRNTRGRQGNYYYKTSNTEKRVVR